MADIIEYIFQNTQDAYECECDLKTELIPHV